MTLTPKIRMAAPTRGRGGGAWHPMIRRHHHKGITFIVATAILLAAAGVLALTQSQPAPAQDLKAIKADYRRPAALPVENKALANLGRDLPELGYVVTEAHPINDSGKPTSRKSQPLIGLGHAGKALIGWDGRSATLEAQTKSSIATGSMSMRETSSPVKVEIIEERVKSDSGYAAKFNAALPGRPIDVDAIAAALAAFERTLEPAITPFDRWIAGDETAISAAAKRGFALFNGKAACVACHNGWRFTDDQFHDIGTTTTDQGRGKAVKDETLNFAFKTPTLRAVAVRAPYMHNASLATLDDVMRHYEKGGIDRPSRSPLLVPIQLSDAERGDLVAFMETLTGNGEGAKLRR